MLDTTTSPASPAATTRDPMFTAMPPTSFPRISTSPECNPTGTSSPTARRRSRIARAHRIARAGASKSARNPSPVVLISRPPCAIELGRTSSSWRSSSSRQLRSPISAARSVDSTISLNITVARTRSVSESAGSGAAGPSANAPSTRRVTPGDSKASPRATARTPCRSTSGSVSLTRKPLAPTRSASNTYSSTSNVVRITILVRSSCSSCTIRRVASSPSMPGMRMSMSTTSGTSSDAMRTASSPSSASPTTWMSVCASSSALKPARTSA